MRRALVLTDEHRRHPFLASLPQHVRTSVQECATPSWRLSRSDLKQAASTYVAGFVAVSLYIA